MTQLFNFMTTQCKPSPTTDEQDAGKGKTPFATQEMI